MFLGAFLFFMVKLIGIYCKKVGEAMHVRLLAVTDIRGVIATTRDDNISWGSMEDKTLFKEITTNSGVVVMGRKTFESIGKKLSNRFNVVLSTRNIDYFEKFAYKPDLILPWNAHKVVETLNKIGYNDICVIGGQSVFTQFLNEGIVTDIHLTIEPVILPGNFYLFSNEITRKFDLILQNIRKLNDMGAINVHYIIKY